MKRLCHWVAGILLAVGGFAPSAWGQAVISMQPRTSGPITPGTTRAIDVFINNVVTGGSVVALQAYQVTLEAVPLSGAAGTLNRAPDSLTGVYTCLGGTRAGLLCSVASSSTDCPGGECSGPVFVDQTRADHVFAGLSQVTASIPGQATFGAALLNPAADSVQVTTLKYAGTIVFQASANALGDFQVRLRLTDPITTDLVTFLIDKPSYNDLIPFTSTPITVNVRIEVPNDDCPNATTITDGITMFTTENADTDGPAHPGSGCDVGGSSAVENDVWYNYTSSCTGILTVSTCGTADFDTRVAVYNGCTCPVTNGGLISCNDDSVGCSGGTSEVVVNASQGSCYKVRIGGKPGLSGDGNITISCVGNDTCATAKVVSVPSTNAGATINASNDAGLPACGPAISSPGVWYRVTGNGGVISASLCGAANYDSRLTVFQGSACGSLTCVGNVNNTCGNQESLSWCSTSGTQYFILVHGNGGAEGTFTLGLTTQSCDDSNACTQNVCSSGVCSNPSNPGFDPVTECCNRSNGVEVPITDNNPCTNDVCNSVSGQVTHSPVPNGPSAACDDGEGCTIDECLGGACHNQDIEELNIPCTFDAQCPGESLCGGGGVCLCGATLDLLPVPSGGPVSTCYGVGGTLTVNVELTAVATAVPIVGAQFFLEYDAAALDFLSIEPGDRTSPSSPFSSELTERVDENLGAIDYVVFTGFSGGGTLNPARLATLTFDVIDECEPFLRFRQAGTHGEPNRLSDNLGGEVIPGHLFDMPEISTSSTPPTLSQCPSNMNLDPDAGEFTAMVNWATPTALDNCDGALPVICNPPSGSDFGPGTTPVNCEAVNSCSIVGSCSFNVTVAQPTVTVDVQLSPTMANGPFTRCITFDLWGCNVPGGPLHSTVSTNLTFAGGTAANASVRIPGGDWDCITARDRLHTLRSTADSMSSVNGVDYDATFVGSRASGGHWLLGGNLNDDDYIDVLDFGVFINRFLSPANPNTVCGTPPPDANINGDGVVDLVDFVFVQVNALEASEPGCCGTVAAASAGPIMSISVQDLRRMGLGELRSADLNHDGILDGNDIAAFMSGARPARQGPPHKAPSRPVSLRKEGE